VDATYSVRGLPVLEDIGIDLGAYRYQKVQEIITVLIEDRLGLPHKCYDPANCSTHIIVDQNGVHVGFLRGIEALLKQLESRAGNPIFTGYQLVKVDRGDVRALKLIFANGQIVETDKLLLNIPSGALMALDPSSIIFTHATEQVKHYLGCPISIDSCKYYVVYNDAWWLTKLGNNTGNFTTPNGTTPPISGRYNDGGVKCIGANCRGALLVFYRFQQDVPFYAEYQANLSDPFTLLQPGSDRNGQLLTATHKALMDFHREAFEKIGINPDTIPPPELGLLGFWLQTSLPNPGVHLLNSSDSDAPKLIIKPLNDFDIFVANEAWPPFSEYAGWAEGALILAERTLHHNLGLEKPSWISTSYYNDKIVNPPIITAEQAIMYP